MTSCVRYEYKEGKLDYFVIRTPKSGDIYFAGQVPLYFAVKYAEKILACENCQNYAFWGGLCIGMCANCGFETSTQKGFLNYGQEYEYKSCSHLPSVWDTYLADEWDLTRIGDKTIVNTVWIMVEDLFNNLLYKFGDEKRSAIHGLCDYLRSLDHDPRQAISRMNELRDIPEEELCGRNWVQFWSDPKPSEDPLPRPVLTRIDTEYHCYQNDLDESSGETCVLDEDAVSEISEVYVEEIDYSKLTPEQQNQLYQAYDASCTYTDNQK